VCTSSAADSGGCTATDGSGHRIIRLPETWFHVSCAGTCACLTYVQSRSYEQCWARDGRLSSHCWLADGAGTYQAGAGERVNIVLGWLYASLAARRHAGGLDIDAPVLANVWARLADGYASFEACRSGPVDHPFTACTVSH
jgi:hypothetical protein